MNNKCALLIAVTILVIVPYCSSNEISADKLRKAYEKINKYLEKNVQSDDPAINMAKVEELLSEKSASIFTFFTGKYLIEALKLLKEFATLPEDDVTCKDYDRIRLAEQIDSGLADVSRLQTPNYTQNRVDKIIEHYAVQDAMRCGYYVLPKLAYGYKQIAYDIINARLVDALPKVDDVATDVAKAEELLKGMPDGALADALRHFVQLKLTLNEDTCNERGYGILLKNDLATKGQSRSGPQHRRRIDKIVRHFALEHERICKPVVMQSFQSELKNLDPRTYRLILGLASSYYLNVYKYDQLISELNQKEVNGDYYTPSIVEYVKEELDNCASTFYRLYQIGQMDLNKLYHFVKAASFDDANTEYLGPVVAEKAGEKVVNDDGLERLLNNYLFEPCERFLHAFKGSILDDFGERFDSLHMSSHKDRFLEEITYHTVHSGYYACKSMYHEHGRLFEGFKNKILRTTLPGTRRFSSIY